MPFALIGGLVAFRIWHELPAATRDYINNVERKGSATRTEQRRQVTVP